MSILSNEIRTAITRVLLSPRRLGFLVRGGAADAYYLAKFLLEIVPLAKAELAQIERLADRIPDSELRHQARSSLRGKAYHVAGACVLATFLPRGAREHYIRIVAPLESIYDFLDCLCDRHAGTPIEAVRHLHEALSDAVDPHRPLNEYYTFGPQGDDGGYLNALVARTRSELAQLAEHERLVPYFHEAASLYANHQALKHEAPAEREKKLQYWHARDGRRFGALPWFEFAAAAGSQFHLYGPLYGAFCSRYDLLPALYTAYFPEFAALHVLFDAFIDQAEDRVHGELNWLAYYQNAEAFVARVFVLAEEAQTRFRKLPSPRPHLFALRVLILFYLTHPKVFEQRLNQEAIALLEALA